jgi:succinate-acetate transporter protein
MPILPHGSASSSQHQDEGVVQQQFAAVSTEQAVLDLGVPGPPEDDANHDGSLSLMYDDSETPASPIRTRVRTVEYVPASAVAAPISTTTEAQPQPQQYHHHHHLLSGNVHHHREFSSGTSVPKLCTTDTNGESSSFCDPKKHTTLVAVRYFLDRPGYGLHNSAVRLWFDPPCICTPADLQQFLIDQGIALQDLLVEVFLDKFQSFMMLEACEAAAVEWNLQDTSTQNPGVFNIRLTDVTYAQRLDQDLSKSRSEHGAPPSPQPPAQQQPVALANTTPVGLFAFSVMTGLEAASVMASLWPNEDFIDAAYVLAWGPYMYFVGGGLLTITGYLQVYRNNIYGAVAFLGFGAFWFANGTKVILETHFSAPGTIAAELLAANNGDPPYDPWGALIRACYSLAFTLALLKQTFVMSKLSTTLITLLAGKVLFQAVAGWSDVMAWLQVCFGWLTSWFAFYVFLVEFTNQVYHRDVFCTYKWSLQNSPEEVFGAAGSSQTLYSKAAKLRQARYPNVSRVRSAMAKKLS